MTMDAVQELPTTVPITVETVCTSTTINTMLVLASYTSRDPNQPRAWGIFFIIFR